MTVLAHISTAVVHLQVQDYYSKLVNGSGVSAIYYMLCFVCLCVLFFYLLLFSWLFLVFGLVT